MSTLHTPGPWMPAAKANGATVRHPAIISDSGQVGNATWQGNERATDANARLIAAAPELLDALNQIIDWNRQHARDQFGDADKAESWVCVIRARAAIAKATGETK